jgi:LysM repeat protein
MRFYKLLFFILISSFSYAQSDVLVAKRSGEKLFLEHKVLPKENWYSIGRKYEISPKEIAPFNGLSMDKGLAIGQMLKIPLNGSNFNQESETKFINPVVHQVASKEGLFRIANEYGITIAQLKKWNRLTSDQVKSGDYLIVGFIKASSTTVSDLTQNTPAISEKVEPEVKTIPLPEPKKSVLVVPATKAETKTDEKKLASSTKEVADPVSKKVKSTGSSLVGTGYFSGLFTEQSKEGIVQNLEGFIYGVFKSTSGWEDEKFYVLLNDVVPGTIVRITLKETEKSVFAKVLGSVPTGKESDGMSMRMSNATASALGLSDTTKNLMLTWYK